MLIKNNNKGFTLVELLSILAILSIVITIVITIALNVVNSSKGNSYKVTINNVEKEAGSYVIENNDNFSWRYYDDIVEYQCITVQHLIDKGYFSNDILKSYVTKDKKIEPTDYIYLERNKDNKNIEKEILLYEEKYGSFISLCDNSKALGEISLEVSPSGWAKEKTVTVRYRLSNNLEKITNYNYGYSFVENTSFNSFTNNVIVEDINVNQNGDFFAVINQKDGGEIARAKKEITKIDNIRPVVSMETYSGAKKVSKKVEILLKVTDEEPSSGIKYDSLDVNKISVYVNENTKINDLKLEYIKADDVYRLTINNNDKNVVGAIKIVVNNDAIYDNVGNGNLLTQFYPGVEFSNVYKVEYIANGGQGTMSNTECVYGSTCKIKENGFTYNNYTFVGWSTKSDNTDDGYGWTNFNSTWEFEDGNKGVVGDTLKLYARWRKNRAYVKFDTAGGTIKSSTTNDGVNYTWTTGDTGIISRQSGSGAANNKFFYIEYGSKKDLPNWNNSTYINITRTNYSAVSNKEWICESGCTTSGKTFDHTVEYSPSDFCDITDGDCTVAVGVNWKRNTTIKYVNATSGLNCRKGPSTSYGINSSYNKSCGSSITGYNYNSSWFYVESTGCYYSNSYLQSSKSGISCGSSPSSGGGGGGGGTGGSTTTKVGICQKCKANEQCPVMNGQQTYCRNNACKNSSGQGYTCCVLTGSGGFKAMICD